MLLQEGLERVGVHAVNITIVDGQLRSEFFAFRQLVETLAHLEEIKLAVSRQALFFRNCLNILSDSRNKPFLTDLRVNVRFAV